MTAALEKPSKILRVVLPLLVIGLALLAAQALMLFGPTVPKTSRGVKPTFVEVLTARVQDERAVIVAYGTVHVHQRLIVQPEINGRVVKLNPRFVIGGDPEQRCRLVADRSARFSGRGG